MNFRHQELRKWAQTAIIATLQRQSEEQMSPVPLVKAVEETLDYSMGPFSAEDRAVMEKTMWQMCKSGELIWTKEGPIKLVADEPVPEPEAQYVYQVECNGARFDVLHYTVTGAREDLERRTHPSSGPIIYRALTPQEAEQSVMLAGSGLYSHLTVRRRVVQP